ncbi:MAG TPA: methyltransferase domain-containing protein [Saprospiraceae bacterium]|nr:methyltransferase domain-containing protein [Saprospiraceae bacterium]
MYEFHSDKDRYFDIQYRVTKEYILPFIEKNVPGKKWNRVLEIGCAEAGVLKCFLEEGAFCTGIELSAYRLENAEKFHAQALKEGRIEFINRNIFDIDPEFDLGGLYDLIILKDVIEHIPGQKEFMYQLPSFLNAGGYIFFAFPPWQMPYGGHQQVCKSKFLSKLPYFHLLPKPIYKGILKLFGESDLTIKDLLEVKATGISIERFERYLKYNNLNVAGKQHYLFNPIYQYKFNIRPRSQYALISWIPWLRNFLTTGVYYLVNRD